MGRIPRIIDWDRNYNVSIGLGTGKHLSQDGIDYNTQGVEIIHEDEQGEEGQEEVEQEEVLVPKLFNVPSVTDNVGAIRELYEEHVGPWSGVKGSGYMKKKNAIDEMRKKLDELLGVA
jgi:hypothetical protein